MRFARGHLLETKYVWREKRMREVEGEAFRDNLILIGVSVDQAGKNGHDDDSQIESERPVL
jgi:hypothetical protein